MRVCKLFARSHAHVTDYLRHHIPLCHNQVMTLILRVMTAQNRKHSNQTICVIKGEINHMQAIANYQGL